MTVVLLHPLLLEGSSTSASLSADVDDFVHNLTLEPKPISASEVLLDDEGF